MVANTSIRRHDFTDSILAASRRTSALADELLLCHGVLRRFERSGEQAGIHCLRPRYQLCLEASAHRTTMFIYVCRLLIFQAMAMVYNA